MVSAVRSRPNHYETLGVTPAAGGDEIARAFAKEIGRPRAFGGVAEVSIAYATLRDPLKRRVYDSALGLGPEPDPPAAPRTATFIAASLRAPVNLQLRPETALAPSPKTELQHPPQLQAKPRLDPAPGGAGVARNAPDQRLADAEDGSIEWKRTAIALAGLIAAVGLFGAWAGWEAGNDMQSSEPDQAVKVALPPPSDVRPSVTAPAVPVRGLVQARVTRPKHRAAAAPPPERAPPTPAAAQPPPPEVAQSERNQPEESAAEPAAAETPPSASAAPANLPLSNRIIARTIERIGYACGKVASTSAVEGGGAFKVNCTSGNSYRASPVRGRFHFRRWGSH